ncbi:MAG: hypothetical protein JW827_02955 [Spirochaetes bacterium]|nr:hypothetical protein [Spirochaetota bacterium]
MKKIILAAILGGLIVLIWGSATWMALDVYVPHIKTLPNANAVLGLLSKQKMEHAVYHFPGYFTGKTDKQLKVHEKRMLKGPNINFMVYSPKGYPPFSPKQFIIGLLNSIVACFIVALILSKTKSRFYISRVFLVTLFGVFAACLGPVANWNWWLFPMGFTVISALDLIFTWFLAGLIIAALVRPQA